MIDYKKKLQFIVEGGNVRRFHTRPGITVNTDAHHSHGVAMMCHVLTEGRCSKNLLMAALTHDLAEQKFGDVSAPAKRITGIGDTMSTLENTELAKWDLYFPLEESEMRVLKIADSMDGMLYCVHENSLGNRYVQLMYRKWHDWLVEENELSHHESNILNAIHALWQGIEFDVFKE